MKRTFTLFVAVVLFVSMFPLNAFAAEAATSEYDELIKLACEVFPEYESKILGNKSSTYSLLRTSDSSEPVMTLTRAVSDTEEMVYTEYANGVILLSDYQYNKKVTVVDRYTSSPAVSYTINIMATISGPYPASGYFKASNIKFTLISQDNDCITDIGTTTCTEDVYLVKAYDPVLNESESGNATLKYSIRYQIGPTAYYSLYSILTLSVGDNTYSVTNVED